MWLCSCYGALHRGGMKRSQAEIDRQKGKYQVEAQRERILDAAERLFLAKGIENSSMVEVAAEAGITKVTVYRYFPNIDAIALGVQLRQMNKITAVAGVALEELEVSLESARALSRNLIGNFEALRDAYRYMGMFDSIYLDKSFESELPQQTKSGLKNVSLSGVAKVEERVAKHAEGDRFNLILSTVIWFLEKVAMRGELTWSDQETSLEAHLMLFEEMIVGYIDGCLAKEEGGA